MKDCIKIIVMAIVVIAMTILCCTCEYCMSETAYNDGKCECGGEWELFDVEMTRSGWDYYYYKCPNCNNTIQTSVTFD